KAIGIEITVPITAPTAIFFITMADIPSSFNSNECSNIGLDITPPGNPTNAVGMEFVRFNVTIAAIKNVKITIGGTPDNTTVKVIGMRTEVSSVPGINPINV